MDDKKLTKALNLRNKIDSLSRDISGLDEITADYDAFGCNVSFKRNSDSFERSFGSKKHNFKEKMLEIIHDIKREKIEELKALSIEFENL